MRGSVPRALAAMVIVSGVAAATWSAGRGDTAEAAVTETRVVLSDDFSGDRGGEPDGDVWTATGSGGTARLDGEGRLALGSALRTETIFEQESGHVEARIKGDRADGAWRALGVLDASGRVPAGQPEILASDQVDSGDFHTYAIDWTPTTLTWSLDGRQVLRFTPEQKGMPKIFVLNGAAGGQNSSGMLVDQVEITVQVPVDTSSAKQWKAFIAYKAGDLVKYRTVVYRVREAHTSLPDWKPDLVPALFEKV
ncbi:family 16 glycosylhydrolase [Actinoplanes sp. NEAU-A12]|uniref:Family 16 glycosylhydrolase n=1 Tax=Actinoplanes sandaracinus TaxID=3045177 RepID=A0ABT6WDV6_9ACTN|nr:carbohydrate-binding protein [Actinoplanes sandaracinus]MDI6097906.1 family 16 glycosylhydrolase [Actinoplanes sandaracinus]